MTDFLLHRTSDGVELIPRTHEARLFLEPHRLDGVDGPWRLSETLWAAFRLAIAAKGLTVEEAS
jgi:hypothetical protein